MSQYQKEYTQFFESPAGVSFLTWLQEQRTNEHEAAEKNPSNAHNHAATARAYGQVQQHIDSNVTGKPKSRYSGRGSAPTTSTGLGTSQLNER